MELKRVWIYREVNDFCEKEALRELQEAGIEPKIVGREELATLREDGGEGTLLLTDDLTRAALLLLSGIAAAGWVKESTGFGDGIPYVIQGEELPEISYLNQIYCRMRGLPVEILETRRCFIRESSEADLDAFYEIYEEPSVTRYMEILYPDREKERKYLTSYRENIYAYYGYGIWTVILKETGEIIGRAGIEPPKDDMPPELGFLIGVPWQRRGLATEVCEAILHYAGEELGFDRIHALIQPANHASIALIEKLGFTFLEECENRGTLYGRYERSSLTFE